ncbi:hypothetical protein SLA2020_265520 [Shorea laevis]
MSLLSWNCQGLGNHRLIRDLCQLVKEKRPRFLFLMETKLRQKSMQIVQTNLVLRVCWQSTLLVRVEGWLSYGWRQMKSTYRITIYGTSLRLSQLQSLIARGG